MVTSYTITWVDERQPSICPVRSGRGVAAPDPDASPLAAQVPVVLSEFGQDSCGFDYVNSLLTWADARGLSHTPWTWNPWGSCMILIRDWNGTPEPGFGEFYRTHLLAENPFP